MNKIILSIFAALLIISCKAQEKTPEAIWKNNSFDDARFSIESPCELERTFFKSFQEKPRPIRVFSYECEYEGVKYLASLKEHMDEFDEKRVPNQLKLKEEYLPELFKEKNLEVIFLKKEDLSRNGFPARTFEAEIGGKDLWREFTLVNPQGVYNLTTVLIIKKGSKRSEDIENNFNSHSQKFFDSFHIK